VIRQVRMRVDPTGLVGRDREMAALAAFLDRATTGGSALVLTGEAGVGKTALLDASAALATDRGMRVVRGGGVEYETDIGFAGLHQLVDPVADEIGRLPEATRSALEVALGLATGPPPSRIAVLDAALALFREAARARPLLMIVDDLQVIDEATCAAVSFVGRRLGGHRIGLLAALRTEGGASVRSAGLPELDVAPLADGDALRLLAGRFVHLPRRTLAQLAHDAQGNPLALLEFAGSAALADAGDGLAVTAAPHRSRDVRALFGARVGRLPAPTRELLLLAALAGSDDVGVLEAAAGQPGLEALQPAERDHLVMVDEDGRAVRFRHPLVRSAVVEGSTGAQRRRAHRRLAAVLVDDPLRRGDHLERATTAPDGEVAEAIETAARMSLQRSDAAGAVARLRRAAELSPDATVRSRRFSRAAYLAAWVVGDLATARDTLRQAEADPSDPTLGGAAAAAFVLLVADGDADKAHALLTTALARVPAEDPVTDETIVALFALTLICQYSGREEHWRPLMELIAPWRETPAGSAPSLARIHGAPGATTSAALRGLDEEITLLADEHDADVVVRTALAASYLDRLAGCREAIERVIADGDAVGASMPALMFVALDDLYGGRWQDCARTAAELVALCEEAGYHLFGHVGRYIGATAAAQLGDLAACRERCEQIWSWAQPRGLLRLERCAHQAAARAAVGAADFERALRHAVAISPAGELPPFNPEAVWAAPDLVEAALRTGHADDAERHAAALRSSGIGRISARHALVVATATAMTTAPEDAEPLFEDALRLPGIEQHAFELARAHLAYGELLRRRGQPRQARTHLAAAHERFERLGAASWGARAAGELRATGLTRLARSTVGDRLTPQELEVAELAATGLSNPQIAARLVLSPRTVSTHLYRVFPKLGITSRASLRDALDSAQTEQTSEQDLS